MKKILLSLVLLLSTTIYANEKNSYLEDYLTRYDVDELFIKELPKSGIGLLDVAHFSSVDLHLIQTKYGYLKTNDQLEGLYLLLVPALTNEEKPNYSLFENRNSDFKQWPVVGYYIGFVDTKYFEDGRFHIDYAKGVFIGDGNAKILAREIVEGKYNFDIQKRPVYFVNAKEVFNTPLVVKNYSISPKSAVSEIEEYIQDIFIVSRDNGLAMRVTSMNKESGKVRVEVTAPIERFDIFVSELKSKNHITLEDE
jgi:hypothetical protein